jgi:hypothetical protein
MALFGQELLTTPVALPHLITPGVRASNLVGDDAVDAKHLTGVTWLPGLTLIVGDVHYVLESLETYTYSKLGLSYHLTSGAERDNFAFSLYTCGDDSDVLMLLLRHTNSFGWIGIAPGRTC